MVTSDLYLYAGGIGLVLLSPILFASVVLYVLQSLRIETPIPVRVALTRIVVPLVGIVFGPQKRRLLDGWLHEGSGAAKAKKVR
jgi:hypothetical protein